MQPPKGTKPIGYYRDQNGIHPLLPLDSYSDIKYATEEYVNASLAATTLNMFFTDTASSEVSGYYEMPFTETGAAGSSLTANSVSNGDLLWSFISPEFDVVDQLSAGLYIVSLWAEQDSNKTVTLTAKLYKRDSGGTETLLLETSTSDEIPKNTKTQIIMSGFLENDEEITNTDRVVLKIYANVSGGGGAPNITIYMEGTDDSRIAVRIPTSVITSKIFDADGDTYVTVEKTTDEDKIHFYTAGSERVTIDSKVYIATGLHVNNPSCDVGKSLVVDDAIGLVYFRTTHYGHVDFYRSDGVRGAYIGWGDGGDKIEFYPDNATEINIGRDYGWLKVRRYPFTNNVRGFSQASNASWKASGEAYKTFAISVYGNNIYLYWVDSSGNYRYWTTSGTVL